MKKKVLLPSILIVFLIVVGYSLVKPKKIVIGYCPTMAVYTTNLQYSENITLVAYSSSQEALNKLASGQVDCVIIGRKARDQETTANVSFQQFNEKATTLVKKINTDNGAAFLMPWQEVDCSQVELVILTDKQGHKLAEHRTPFLYYSDQLSENQIDQIADLIKQNI